MAAWMPRLPRPNTWDTSSRSTAPRRGWVGTTPSSYRGSRSNFGGKKLFSAGVPSGVLRQEQWKFKRELEQLDNQVHIGPFEIGEATETLNLTLHQRLVSTLLEALLRSFDVGDG